MISGKRQKFRNIQLDLRCDGWLRAPVGQYACGRDRAGLRLELSVEIDSSVFFFQRRRDVERALVELRKTEERRQRLQLLPRHIEFQVLRALLSSLAAEHAARMTAMDAASKNAAEMIDALTLTYNRVRQASITKELIEIVSGAEALGER